MGKDAQLIFGGGGDVTLYDASNGYFNLGYLADIEFTRAPNKITTNRSMVVDLHGTYTFKATALQSNDDVMNALDARRNTLQTVYIVGAGRLFTLPAQFVTYEVMAPFKEGEAQTVIVEGKSASDFTQEINLLGDYGGFETDTNSDGVTDGWNDDSLANVSQESNANFTAANRSGDYCQQIEFPDGSAGRLYLTAKVCPFEGPLRLTFSAYIYAVNDVTFNLRIQTLNTSDAVITTYTSSNITMSATDETRQSFSAWVNETSTVKSIIVDFYRNAAGTPAIQIEHAVLSIENLRDYTED